MECERIDSSVVDDSEDEFIVIKSKKVLLRDRVKQLIEENEGLEYEKSSLKLQMEDRDREITALKKINNNLMDKVKATEQKNCVNLAAIEELAAKARLSAEEVEDMRTELKAVKQVLEQKCKELDSERTRRDELDNENKTLKKMLEEMNKKCELLDNNNSFLMNELLESDKGKLRKNETESIVKPITESVETIEERKVLERDLKELRANFQMVCDECERLSILNNKLENRINKIKGKVKKYFDVKSYYDPSMSSTLSHSLISRSEVELKQSVTTDLELNERMTKSLISVFSDDEEDSDLVPLECVICKQSIHCSEDKCQMFRHWKAYHSQCLCPICYQRFDLTFEGHTKYFELHLGNHSDIPYPHDRKFYK